MSWMTRAVCEAENGDGKGWHYICVEQETLDENITCPTHPTATVRDYVVEKELPPE